MEPVKIRSYLSPTMVLLAFNWEEGAGRSDFLGSPSAALLPMMARRLRR
jgi:hypothetical protein